MTPDSLKRLLTLAVAAALNLLAPKLGLSADTVAGINMLVAVFLAQSGVNAALTKLASSKAGGVAGTLLTDLAKVKAAFDQAKAAQALAAGQAAGGAPPAGPGASQA